MSISHANYVGVALSSVAAYGNGTGSILFGEVNCTGEEVTLLDCPNSGSGNYNCLHLENAGVRCQPGDEIS